MVVVMWVEIVMWCTLGLSLVSLLSLSAWMEWKRYKAFMEVQRRKLEFFRIFHIWAYNDLRSYTVSSPDQELIDYIQILESMLSVSPDVLEQK